MKWWREKKARELTENLRIEAIRRGATPEDIAEAVIKSLRSEDGTLLGYVGWDSGMGTLKFPKNLLEVTNATA